MNYKLQPSLELLSVVCEWNVTFFFVDGQICWSSSIPQCTAAVLRVHVKADSHRCDRAADMAAVEVALSGPCFV